MLLSDLQVGDDRSFVRGFNRVSSITRGLVEVMIPLKDEDQKREVVMIYTRIDVPAVTAAPAGTVITAFDIG